ncbi:MAG: DNA alkylation repair protein [Duncaniella sp.]|nr:DNA alkylation repair protein [Duncaniella sp.]
MTEFNQTQEIKRRFFAMRNGIVADTIRKGGLDYKMIFGLNLPQIKEIAASLPHTAALAEEMWSDRRTRESMLLAPMLYPVEEMDMPTALRWASEAPTTEVSDILCHSLLRRHPAAWEIAMEHVTSPSEMNRYTAFRLLFNLLYTRPADIRPFAEAEYAAASPLTRPLCHSIIEEIDFISETL